MLDRFRQAYSKLTEFITNHPEIEVGESVISIPETVRAQFYELFNASRTSFVEGRFPDFLHRAETLKSSYNCAANEVSGLITFEDPSTAAGAQRFLSDPTENLARELFDPLFDLLKARDDMDAFEKKVSGSIERLFPIMLRAGYEKWVVLSLVSLLNADKAFRVDARQLYPGERAKSAAHAPMDEVPRPFESNSFLFAQPRNMIFAVPDFIVYSARLNQYIGVRSDFRSGLYNALNPSCEREWYPLNPDMLKILNRGLTLIYKAEQPESISLVADVGAFCKPDMILWCVDPQILPQTEALAKATLFNTRFKPLNGSYIIAMEKWPEHVCDSAESESELGDFQPEMGERPEGIHLLTIGFDKSKLGPVIDALINTSGTAATT